MSRFLGRDARNEALIDWVINGDPRLGTGAWNYGQSLERTKIVESPMFQCLAEYLTRLEPAVDASLLGVLSFTKDRAGSENCFSL